MESPFVFRNNDKDNLEIVRQIILQRLKDDDTWHQFDYTWDDRNQNHVTFEHAGLRIHFLDLANEAMWQFIVQGVITVGMNANNPNLPFFRVTNYGNEVLAEERFIPHDPTGYLEEIGNLQGTTSANVSTVYIEEALRCFSSGCHVASVLLLGVAAESIFNCLCDDVESALNEPAEKARLQSDLPVKPRHRFIVEKYNSLTRSEKRQLPESLDMTLTSLYDLIRRQRNELGHPQDTSPNVSREEAFVIFKLLPDFIRDAGSFADYCRVNGI